jgi:hypothetical protein
VSVAASNATTVSSFWCYSVDVSWRTVFCVRCTLGAYYYFSPLTFSCIISLSRNESVPEVLVF